MSRRVALLYMLLVPCFLEGAVSHGALSFPARFAVDAMRQAHAHLDSALYLEDINHDL